MLLLVGCDRSVDSLPDAPNRPVVKRSLGEPQVDSYSYLSDLSAPDTVEYIASERLYADDIFQQWSPLRLELHQELNRALPKATTSAAVRLGDYHYWREILPGSQYPVFFRRLVGAVADAPQVVLDVNVLAAGNAYYSLGDFSVSPDGRWVAFTEDDAGSQVYRLRILEIANGAELAVSAGPVGASLGWLSERALYYLPHARTVASLDPFSGVSSTVYEEADPSFHLRIRLSRERNRLVLSARNPLSTEVRLVDKQGRQQVISPRQKGHHYQVRLSGESVYALTNQRRPGFELARADLRHLDEWAFFPTPPGTIRDFEAFSHGLVLLIEHQMTSSLYAFHQTEPERLLLRASPVETLSLSSNPDPSAAHVRIVRTAPHLSKQLEEVNLLTGDLRVLDDSTVQAFKPRLARRDWFDARDGARVPVTWLATPETAVPAPALILVYGAYGVPQDQSYQPNFQPLLDRGFAVIQIHVRGGGELGPGWHEAGRLRKKQNSINDLVDGIDYLLGTGRVDPKQVFIRGVSAGALTAAAAMNTRPGLFAGVILRYPFLDLVGSLIDQSEQLTPSDLLEWGDPGNPEDLRYMLSYAPYEQIRSQVYPPVLLTAATHDTRTTVGGALKWLAKLRNHDTGQGEKLLNLLERSGHQGPSDQYEIRQLDALEYAFILTRP